LINPIPAQWITQSIPPMDSLALATSDSAAWGAVMSEARVSIDAAPAHVATTSESLASDRPCRVSLAPRVARRMASSRPIPLEAPVMRNLSMCGD
jgi:hypothetical protein